MMIRYPILNVFIMLAIGISLIVWRRQIEDILNEVRRTIPPPFGGERRVSYGCPLAAFGAIFVIFSGAILVTLSISLVQMLLAAHRA